MLPVLGAPQAGPATLGLHLEPCTQGKAKLAAECGTFGVYEDRQARAGRIISLRLVVIKAEHPTQRAIALIAGGPGQSSVAQAGPIADGVFENESLALRNDYDILFVDNRGMGASHPFKCDLAPLARPQDYFRALWPDALLSKCHAKSATTSRPSLYNTNNAVDDLDDVRAALGYPKLVLDGGSYGTFFSFIYIRRHPNHVESAILNSAYAPHFQPLPGAPDGAQAALDDLVAKCRTDKMCAARFPDFQRQFAWLAHRFDRGPILVPVKNAVTAKMQTVRLSKEVFVDRFRQVLYDPQTASSVPYVVERAYRGDYAPLAQVIDVVSLELAEALDYGAFLSYTCADEIPFVSEKTAKSAAAHSFTADLRLRAQQRACSIWRVPAMPPSFNAVVRSDLPILLITGSDDPATPPAYTAAALPYLPNAKEIVVQGAGHDTQMPCTQRLIVQFVRANSAKELIGSQCRAALKTPPFDTSMKSWPNP